MNQSLRAIIDNALDDGQYDSNAYNTAEHVDTVFDTDVEKLASALEFLGGNLNNIGTADEKLADMYELQKLAFSPEYLAQRYGGTVADYQVGGKFYDGSTFEATDAGRAKGDTGYQQGNRTMYRQPGKTSNPSVAAAGQTAAANAAMEQNIDEAIKKNPALAGSQINPELEARKRAYSLGKSKATFTQGLENTWKSGVGGKAALIGGGAALLGTGALLGSALSKESQFAMADRDIFKLAGKASRRKRPRRAAGETGPGTARRAVQRELGAAQADAAAEFRRQQVTTEPARQRLLEGPARQRLLEGPARQRLLEGPARQRLLEGPSGATSGPAPSSAGEGPRFRSYKRKFRPRTSNLRSGSLGQYLKRQGVNNIDLRVGMQADLLERGRRAALRQARRSVVPPGSAAPLGGAGVGAGVGAGGGAPRPVSAGGGAPSPVSAGGGAGGAPRLGGGSPRLLGYTPSGGSSLPAGVGGGASGAGGSNFGRNALIGAGLLGLGAGAYYLNERRNRRGGR